MSTEAQFSALDAGTIIVSISPLKNWKIPDLLPVAVPQSFQDWNVTARVKSNGVCAGKTALYLTYFVRRAVNIYWKKTLPIRHFQPRQQRQKHLFATLFCFRNHLTLRSLLSGWCTAVRISVRRMFIDWFCAALVSAAQIAGLLRNCRQHDFSIANAIINSRQSRRMLYPCGGKHSRRQLMLDWALFTTLEWLLFFFNFY